MVPLFCFEPRLFAATAWADAPKTGPFRAAFLLESVAALRAALRSTGSDLLTVNCAPKQAVAGANLFPVLAAYARCAFEICWAVIRPVCQITFHLNREQCGDLQSCWMRLIMAAADTASPC